MSVSHVAPTSKRRRKDRIPHFQGVEVRHCEIVRRYSLSVIRLNAHRNLVVFIHVHDSVIGEVIRLLELSGSFVSTGMTNREYVHLDWRDLYNCSAS